MATAPTNIRALQEQGCLELRWDDEKVYRIPYKYVRGECPCASCIEEWTGRRLLDLDSIPDEIKPTTVSFTGNYALKIAWSDGHSTGLYTWDHLAEICRRHGN
jgi:DUF971 family protein